MPLGMCDVGARVTLAALLVLRVFQIRDMLGFILKRTSMLGLCFGAVGMTLAWESFTKGARVRVGGSHR